MKKLLFLLILLLQTILFSVTSFANVSYLEVTDSLVGLNVYYSIDDSLEIERAKLVLVDSNDELIVFDKLKHSGSIAADNFKVAGSYTLVLGYKVNGKYIVIERDNFRVKNSTGFGMGGDVFLQAVGDKFEFTELPENAAPFDTFSLTVKALNPNGQVNVNFTGTVVFESDDVNAELPEDYTFLVSDAGVKKFENGFSLAEIGSSTVTVYDKADPSKKVEVDIEVEVEAGNGQGASSTKEIEIESPSSGVVTNSIIEFVGTVDPGLEVQVFDKGVYLDKANAGPDGKFTLRTSSLPDGDYVFLLKTSNAESKAINIKIVTTGAKVVSVNVDPSTVVAGMNTRLNVTFDKPVNVVSAIINGTRNPLAAVDDTKKVFAGTFISPLELAEYPVNLDVTNEEGIKSEIESVIKFNVIADDGSNDGVGTGGSITFNVPSQVKGVNLVPEDKRAVLSWNPATDNTGIDFYRIYYGTSESALDFSVETNDPSTSWFVPDLENNTRYYFSVYGVDTEGNEGDLGSQIVSAIPGVVGSTTLHGSADGQVQVGSTAETGPGVLFVFVFALLISSLLRKFKIV